MSVTLDEKIEELKKVERQTKKEQEKKESLVAFYKEYLETKTEEKEKREEMKKDVLRMKALINDLYQKIQETETNISNLPLPFICAIKY